MQQGHAMHAGSLSQHLLWEGAFCLCVTLFAPSRSKPLALLQLECREWAVAAVHKGTLIVAVMKVENITHLIPAPSLSPPAEAHVLFILVTVVWHWDAFGGQRNSLYNFDPDEAVAAVQFTET